jgi:hypothetical protein
MNQPNRFRQEVVIRDIDIPFLDLVRLLVKVAVAAIPAMFILAVLGFLLSAFFAAFIVSLGKN